MSWAFLIYLIDVLTTDGSYGGWGFLMFLSSVVFLILYGIQKTYEQERRKEMSSYNFYEGQTLTLTKPWRGYPIGSEILVMGIWNGSETMRVKLPDNRTSDDDVKYNTIRKVTQNHDKKNIQVDDLTKGPRRIALFGMIICLIGILYANFMPQKETAYKMLAAYVGQNVVESPRTQQLADSTIKYLDAQIQKYTEELDATAKAKRVEKAKEEKESK